MTKTNMRELKLLQKRIQMHQTFLNGLNKAIERQACYKAYEKKRQFNIKNGVGANGKQA